MLDSQLELRLHSSSAGVYDEKTSVTIKVILARCKKQTSVPHPHKEATNLKSHKPCWLPLDQLENLLNRVLCPLRVGLLSLSSVGHHEAFRVGRRVNPTQF